MGERGRGEEGVKQGETGEHRDGEALQILFDRVSLRDACMDGWSYEISKTAAILLGL